MRALLRIENFQFKNLLQIRRFLREKDHLLLTATGRVIPDLPDVGPDDLWGEELLEPTNRVAGIRRATLGGLVCALGATEFGGPRCTVQDLIRHVDAPEHELLSAFLRRLRQRKQGEGWSYLEVDLPPEEPLYGTFLQAQFLPVHRSPQGWTKLAWPSSAWAGKE